MHVQIVTFNLGRMSEGEYIDVASRLAPRFAGLPGLLAKVWLESPESGVYGAIYLWDDVEAMDRFLATDLFEGTNAAFTNLTVDDFSVLENLTRATQPVLTLVEDPAPRGRAPSPRQGTPAMAAPVGAAPAPAAPKAGAAKAPATRKPAARVTKVTAPTGKAAKAGARPRGRKATP